MTGPKRIQRRRTRGWRKPEGAIAVDRTTRWGNPFVIGTTYLATNDQHPDPITTDMKPGTTDGRITAVLCDTPFRAVVWYRTWLKQPEQTQLRADARRLLAGHDLMCWCPGKQACHADVLLEMANQVS